ncbi:hypothetical protein L3V83_02455 [Thiotrichales bacterium 19X7-9]|nr:hypothetical protein [Thiotrichales bacterium 19X7-9]
MNLNKFNFSYIMIFTSLFVLPLLSFADGNKRYWISVTNRLNVPITIEGLSSDSKCMSSTGGAAVTIPANTYRQKAYSIVTGSCSNGEKKMTFKITAKMGLSGESGAEYEYYIRWRHKNRAFAFGNGSGWATNMYQKDSTSSRLNVDYANCTSAKSGYTSTCWGSDWASQEGDGSEDSIEVKDNPDSDSVYDGEYNFNTIQLGDAVVTDGYGKPATRLTANSPIYLAYDQKYVIHFTKSQEVCTIIEGLISCPFSIEYSYLDQGHTIVFACAQTHRGDPGCAWATTG